MLNALAGWFAGFDGSFEFENIGDDYIKNNVPYVKMRAFPAILGAVTVPLVYQIMRESGYATTVAALSACLLLFGKWFSWLMRAHLEACVAASPSSGR